MDTSRVHPASRAGLARALARRPTLAVEALRTVLAVAPRAWWRAVPYLPIPDADYWAWRAETAYGDRSAAPDVDDIVDYLAWRRRQRSIRR